MKSWILFGAIFDTDKISKQLINLRNKTEDQDFWSDPDEAKKVMMNICLLYTSPSPRDRG